MEDERPSQGQANNLLPVSILVGAFLISGSIVYLVQSGQGGAARPASRAPSGELAAVGASSVMELGARDVILGEPDAPVTFIEYGDYQCPFCGRFFSQVEPLLKDNYVKSGKVRMIYRDMAILGEESTAAAEAAECAKDQQKFWAFHDAILEREVADAEEFNGNLNRGLFLAVAKDLGLDAAAFTECVDGRDYADVVEAATEAGKSFGVQGTPTSFVNGQIVRGALPYDEFEAVIEGFLAEK